MRSYLITLATGAALGAGTMELADIQDAHAAPLARPVTVSRDVAPEETAAHNFLNSLQTNLATFMCPDIEGASGIPTADCSVEDGSVLSITFGDTHKLSLTVPFSGTWVKGAPQ